MYYLQSTTPTRPSYDVLSTMGAFDYRSVRLVVIQIFRDMWGVYCPHFEKISMVFNDVDRRVNSSCVFYLLPDTGMDQTFP